MSVRKVTKDGITSFYSSNIKILHGFTGRMGGVSSPPYDELNFGFNRPEKREIIEENYRHLSNAFGFPYESMVLVNYEHGENIERVSKSDCGAGFFKTLPPCDGIITNDRDVTLITLHADCSAFFLFDSENNAIGLAHAGHRGVFLRIGQKMVARMESCFSSNPKNLRALLGPCISERKFEVDNDLGERFIKEFKAPSCCKPGKPGKSMLSLHIPMKLQLIEAGLLESNIDIADLCTFERDDLFYSYRRDKGKTGAMAAFMRL
ncbi:MAG: peptidoglycan editing factor PgeF [Clostridia bacterium]